MVFHKGFLSVVVFAVTLVVTIGCGRRDDGIRDVTIRGVTRVFMHRSDDWSVMVRGEAGTDSLRRIRLTWDTSHPPVTFVYDVPQGMPMRVVVSRHRDGFGDVFESGVVFHLHSPEDVNGAGWDHGKRGRGTTVVVE